MTVSFPEGFTCPPILRDIYPECEREMLPHIKRKAWRVRSIAPHMDLDDAIQEGRLALLSALIRYDFNRCDGDLKRYAGVALDNCYRDMFYRALAQVRMPRGVVRDLDGEWRLTPVVPMSLDEMLDMELAREELHSLVPEPDDVLEQSELDFEAQRFKMKLMNRLKGRAKEVFDCKVNPSTELLKMCDNLSIELCGSVDEDGAPCDIEVPNYAIAKFLKINKNQVDWCVYKIKGAFTQLAKNIDFSELFGDVVESKGWPMIHTDSAEGHNKAFVRRTLLLRGLDPKPTKGWDKEPDHFQSHNSVSRWIERYPWGMVMVLKMDEEWVTMVIEGERVNTSSGAVFGKDGLHEDIIDHVPWYRDVVKRLKEAQK